MSEAFYNDMEKTGAELLEEFGFSTRLGTLTDDNYDPVEETLDANRAYSFSDIKAVFISSNKFPNLDKQYREGLKTGKFQLAFIRGNQAVKISDVIERDSKHFEIVQVSPVKPGTVNVINIAVVNSSPVLSS